MVVRQGMAITGLGIPFGVGAAFLLTRLLAGLGYGVSAHDPLTFALVRLALGAVALLAVYLRARRAARVDPLVARRAE